mmetsp:Transcript_44138/g.42853  ORF Transcript_44138/g.42853 Transcript_44138/m.42853 type:complete len:88 (-) Transcript_44138:864-1127(-)
MHLRLFLMMISSCWLGRGHWDRLLYPFLKELFRVGIFAKFVDKMQAVKPSGNKQLILRIHLGLDQELKVVETMDDVPVEQFYVSHLE